MRPNSTGFTVTSVSPPNGAIDVAPNAIISVTLNRAVELSTVSTRTFIVRGSQTGVYAGMYTTGSVQFDPAQGFKPGEDIVVNLSNDLDATNGISLTPHTWQFRAAVTAVVDGSGVFTDSGQSPGNDGAYVVAMGDLDGDSDLDAFLGGVGGCRVWMNDGAGTLSDSGQNLDYPNRLALGDLDGDGDLDAFVGNDVYHGGLSNRVWLNDATGTFTDSGQSLGSGDSWAVAVGDLDGDGDLDAFVGNMGANKVWLNSGTGTFDDSGQNLGDSQSRAAVLGDLDSDGDLDAFVANQFGQPNKVWLNNGAGIFSESGQDIGNEDSVSLALGNLDGDGDLDVFVGNAETTPNAVWLNNGAGIFGDSGQLLGNSGSEAVALGDVDGDGDLDAFVGNNSYYGTGQPNRVWLNNGAGTFISSGQSLGSLDSDGVALGDLDGDGDLDALVGNQGSDQVNRVWLNQTISPPALSVTKQADPNEVQAGAQLTYTILVVNTGGMDLHATITDTLPLSATLDKALGGTLALPGGTVDLPDGKVAVTWTAIITAPSGLWTGTILVTVDEGYAGPLTNLVEVTTKEGATGTYTHFTRPTPGLIIQGHVWRNHEGGPGLANVAIYRRYAGYPGQLVATTDQGGYYRSDFYYIPGDEMVTVWAELEGYTFDPASYFWRHYYGYEVATRDFVAIPNVYLPLILRQ
jgi:uncharacterized repeat protein (TIGR01451 family)